MRTVPIKLIALSIAFALGGCSPSTPESGQSVAPTQAAVAEVKKSQNDSRLYRSVQLDNGIQVVLVSDPETEKSAAALSVGVGSFNEPKAFGGLAHYLEHMLFMGTKSFPEVGEYSDFISRNGGSQNAYTANDHTNYMVAVNNNAYDEALARFSGFFHEAILDPTYSDKERNAVHSEWTMKGPNDYVIMGELEGLTLNPAHPNANFSWGNLESLADHGELKLQDQLEKFYHDYYSANLMKAAMISSLPLDDMESLAKKHFGKIPNKEVTKPEVTVAAARQQDKNKLVRYKPQTELKQLQVQFTIDNNHNQFAVKPNQYISYLLGSEMPGTLSSTLRDLGLAENLYAFADADAYGTQGSFSIYVDLTEKGLAQRELITGAIFQYIDLIKKDGVDPRFYKEISQSLANEFRFLEKVNDYQYAMGIAAELQYFEPQYVLSNAYEYQQFDANAIHQVLDQLSLENANVWYVDQGQQVDTDMTYFAGQYKVEPIGSERNQSWLAADDAITLSLPAINNLMPEQFDLVAATHSTPKKLVDNEEVEIYLTHSTRFQQPKGMISLQLNTGFDKLSPQHQAMAALTNMGWQQSLMTLSNAASEAGMNLSAEVDAGVSVSVSGFTDKQPELLTSLLTQLMEYRVTPEELANLKASYVADIRSMEQQMVLNQLFPAFSQLIYQDSASNNALLNSVDAITVASLTQFQQQLLAQGKPRVFAFGNYGPKPLTELVSKARSILPTERHQDPFYFSPMVAMDAKAPINWSQQIKMHDSALLDTQLAPLDVNEYAASLVLKKLVSPAIFTQLRSEEQLGYAVGFFNQAMREHLLLGIYIQSPVKGPSELMARFNDFRMNFDKALSETSAEEFTQVRDTVLVDLTQPPKNLREEASDMVADWNQRKLSFDSKTKLVNAVNAVTLKDVQALYSKYLQGSDMNRVVVQMRGDAFKETSFAEFDNQTRVADLDSFQRLSL